MLETLINKEHFDNPKNVIIRLLSDLIGDSRKYNDPISTELLGYLKAFTVLIIIGTLMAFQFVQGNFWTMFAYGVLVGLAISIVFTHLLTQKYNMLLHEKLEKFFPEYLEVDPHELEEAIRRADEKEKDGMEFAEYVIKHTKNLKEMKESIRTFQGSLQYEE